MGLFSFYANSRRFFWGYFFLNFLLCRSVWCQSWGNKSLKSVKDPRTLAENITMSQESMSQNRLNSSPICDDATLFWIIRFTTLSREKFSLHDVIFDILKPPWRNHNKQLFFSLHRTTNCLSLFFSWKSQFGF